MANVIKLKRGSGSDPSASDLAIGELAIRTDTGKIFLKKDNGNIAEVSGGGGLSDGDKGDITVSNSGDTLTIDSGVIDNANINASAAIAGTKISPTFTSDLTVSNASPKIILNDTDHENDFRLENYNGTLLVHDIDANANRLEIASNGTVTVQSNLDVGAGLDVTGAITSSGNLTISNTHPQIFFTDTDNNSDFKIQNLNGAFGVRDETNSVTRLSIASDGTVNIGGNLDVGAGLDVTGSINGTVSSANAQILKLIANMGTNNGRALIFSAPDTDSGSEPFTIATSNALEVDIDGERTLFIDSNGQVNLHHNGSTTAKLSTSSTGVSVTGNITVSGTVDGRDIATDGTKLDGIEASSTADQTANEILTLIKTVDGAGSGLNADLLDGTSSAGFFKQSGSWAGDLASNGFTRENGLSMTGGAEFVVLSKSGQGHVLIDGSYHAYEAGGFYSYQNSAFSSQVGFFADSTSSAKWKGHLKPNADSSQDLGSSSLRWSNLYADTLYGAGSNITALNASNISSGTVAAARLDTATTQSAGNNSTKIATTAYTDTAISNLVDSSPSALNTLNELAAALGDDANFSTTVTNSIATKLPLAGGTLTGNVDLADDVVLRLGTGNDLQIYHSASGNKSYIKEGGAGPLQIESNAIFFHDASNSQTNAQITDGECNLSHSGTKRLKTTSSGGETIGTHVATTFSGSGASLTSLNASNISSGTIAAARVATLNQNTTGSAATLTTARTIAGVSFDGSANISLNNNAITNGAGYITGLSFNNLSGKTSGSGEYSTSGAIVAGRGSGGIALTVNDGYGNANIAFNHKNGTPEQNGNAARIEVNTDATSGAGMFFEVKSNVSSGVAGHLTSVLDLLETQIRPRVDIIALSDSTSDIGSDSVRFANGYFDTLYGDGSNLTNLPSQTDNNFTTTLKNKLDGIAASATNVTNNNQLTNGAGYITASNAAITNKAPLASPTFTGTVTAGVTNLSGELRANANIKITNAGPKISLVDSNADDDFEIKNNNGVFTVRDATDGVDRLKIDSAGTLFLPYGAIYLGTADSSSGHLNAYENMTFNLDTDNDDTNRYFAFYKDGASGSGTELFKIEESGNATFTGSVTTAATVTATGLNLNDTNTVLSEGTSNALRITTDSGFVDIGPKNTSWCHFDTDRASFYFAVKASWNGNILPYSDSAHNLGSNGTRWASIYGDTLYGDGANVTNVNATTLDSIDSGSFVRSDANDSITGHLTITNDSGLKIYSSTNGAGAKINFSDQTSRAQNGTLTYKHADGTITSTGGNSNDGWLFEGTEPRTVVKVIGDLEASANIYGAGAGITALNASNISSGTIAAARLPNHSAALLTSGTIPSARVPTLNQNTTGSAGSFTAGNASNLNSGTVNTARLPATYTKAATVLIQATGTGKDVHLDAADHIILEAGEEEDGSIYFRGNSGADSYRFSKGGQTTHEGFLSFESLGGDRTYTFPNATGTIALTSDLSSYAATSGATFTGNLNIGDGTANERILIKKADNNVSDHIIFYNGTTRIGEIGCHDDTWLRINQTTAKNIYTPRYIRADAGFFVDGTAKGINGSGNFTGGTIAGASDYTSLIRSNADDNVSGHTEWQDNYQVRLGNGADMYLYHNGSSSYIDNITGHIYIRNAGSNDNANIYLQARDGEHSIICEDDNKVRLYFNHTETFRTNSTSSNLAKHTYPWSNNAYDLGSTSLRWRNLYINDLNLSNEGGKNTVDGTWGDWTLQEGEDSIFMINNRSGKKFKMLLQEVS